VAASYDVLMFQLSRMSIYMQQSDDYVALVMLLSTVTIKMLYFVIDNYNYDC